MKLFTVFIWSTFLYCLKKTGLVQNHIFVVCDLYEMSNISLALRRRKRSATTRRQMGRTLMQNLNFCPKIQFWWNLLQHWIWIFPPKMGFLQTCFLNKNWDSATVCSTGCCQDNSWVDILSGARARTSWHRAGYVCARHRLSQNWNFPPPNQKAVSCLKVEKC